MSEEPVLQPKITKFELRNLFSRKNFNRGFEISFDSTMNISMYTQSEQPMVAGKHLTRPAKNGYAAVAIYSNPTVAESKLL